MIPKGENYGELYNVLIGWPLMASSDHPLEATPGYRWPPYHVTTSTRDDLPV
jgi:hypothetical protein